MRDEMIEPGRGSSLFSPYATCRCRRFHNRLAVADAETVQLRRVVCKVVCDAVRMAYNPLKIVARLGEHRLVVQNMFSK